jgi:hypothetical protein
MDGRKPLLAQRYGAWLGLSLTSFVASFALLTAASAHTVWDQVNLSVASCHGYGYIQIDHPHGELQGLAQTAPGCQAAPPNNSYQHLASAFYDGGVAYYQNDGWSAGFNVRVDSSLNPTRIVGYHQLYFWGSYSPLEVTDVTH